MRAGHVLSALLVLVTSCALRTDSAQQDGEPAETPPDATNQTPVKADIETLRDPFWPVGWSPPALGGTGTGDGDGSGLIQWSAATKLLKVIGLSKNITGSYVAIIRGVGVVEQGETISMDYRGLTYKWRLKNITADGIVPVRLGVFRPGSRSD